MSLGTKLKQLRQRNNWSQAEVAYKLDISQPAYNKWESDQGKPSLDKLGKIAEVFEIEIQDLFESEGNVIISNNTFENSNIVYPKDSTVNIQSPELLQSIIKNQEQITKLLEAQSKLIENLLKK
ncbi:HTH-type transcriptional regulator immR [Chryseobacterium gleum]|uniref:HTH-type transcriptional regulator immR n=2 Tax=Chryseobacterium gleum TaxID=250 RepID=A0A3S4MRY6_CHRGE|nr:helix-turn-helix domain-containing protein [Chryseobacterium gleum]EFK37937.1 DNA-binding helix-turn-helix protein [Chryseobacterium gleum ATCC 35910]QBJ87667.1 XRE family transcriptional regulator [Chryseobacterium gleum]QQY32607.1 helix-turn-helix transcriptional regulator [Chryseobacterium gleum]VEE10173.1 HTH-type transcriptional regulator immR [Chryseobacterium gleum]